MEIVAICLVITAGLAYVNNGVLYVLASSSLGAAYVVIIDDDIYDWTSLNRCLLAGYQDLGDKKVRP